MQISLPICRLKNLLCKVNLALVYVFSVSDGVAIEEGRFDAL